MGLLKKKKNPFASSQIIWNVHSKNAPELNNMTDFLASLFFGRKFFKSVESLAAARIEKQHEQSARTEASEEGGAYARWSEGSNVQGSTQ